MQDKTCDYFKKARNYLNKCQKTMLFIKKTIK